MKLVLDNVLPYLNFKMLQGRRRKSRNGYSMSVTNSDLLNTLLNYVLY